MQYFFKFKIFLFLKLFCTIITRIKVSFFLAKLGNESCVIILPLAKNKIDIFWTVFNKKMLIYYLFQLFFHFKISKIDFLLLLKVSHCFLTFFSFFLKNKFNDKKNRVVVFVKKFTFFWSTLARKRKISKNFNENLKLNICVKNIFFLEKNIRKK